MRSTIFINKNRIYKQQNTNIDTKKEQIGLTQAEAAEAAGLSERTYADIERGSVNMRTETILKICEALHKSFPKGLNAVTENKNQSL